MSHSIFAPDRENSLEVLSCKCGVTIADHRAIRIDSFIKYSLTNGKILVEVE